MGPDEYRQSIIDEEHLRLLPVFYWVSGGVTIFFSLYFLIYVALGSTFMFLPPTPGDSVSGAAFGAMFFAIGILGFLLVGVFGILKICAGFWIRQRKHRVTVMVIAGIGCLEVPYGTLLGVLTFMTLGRPSVAALFDAAWVAPPGSPSPPMLSAADAEVEDVDLQPPGA